MEEILTQIIHSPKLEFLFKQIKSILDEEHIKRERFYNEITEFQKAEFINGEIILHSPVRIERTNVGKNLLHLLDLFVRKYNLGFVGYEKTLITLSRNDYEPDICFFSYEKTKSFETGQSKFPVPDFIVEILSPSTEKNDRIIKFEDYAYHCVQEYWIIDPDKQIVEQYLLEDESYNLHIKSDSGIIRSRVVSSFEIPINALFNEKENLNTLQNLMKK